MIRTFKMVSKPIPILLLLLLPLLSTTSASGINITAIMEKYPDYHYFIDFLGQINATYAISQLNAVTVLVLADDNGVEQFESNKLDGNGTVRALQTHVIPEYIDVQSATDKPITYPTFFRTLQRAPRMMGYVNMQKRSDGKVVFGSAVPGAPMNSEVVKTLVAQPPKVAVYHVTTLLVAPGLQQLPWAGLPGSTDPPSSSPSSSDAGTMTSSDSSAGAPAATPPGSSMTSATVAPMASVVHETVSPKASAVASSPKTSTASAPKASESTTAASTAPKASESNAPMGAAGSPESGAASGPGAGGPTTMADGPSSADGPGPAAASGAGKVAFGAGVGMGIVGAVVLSL